MKPQLLPHGQNSKGAVDYTHGVITRQYEYNGETFYFSLHPELYPDSDGLDFTGRYLAVLLSVRGLETFYLAPDETGSYIMDDKHDESERIIEFDAEGEFPEIEGIHTLPANENDEDAGAAAASDDADIHWLRFDRHALMLPLINIAIKEHNERL